ncbi:poly(U)-specific 3'-to-5' RNA exonuclease, variant 3 [Puccinia graminis f. sp. tritici]|uniref:U6 snRNA phosphodiesterase 1 n=2 Tax=Puccinia graminis f. sp. tritici TaxID=56615 RepID=A0A5B0RYJ9_PUCGR|nr:poly(U)-specific 3'-to-5' RNA exonuclease, variant 3 [Puccinia graminis f. sp. tritici]KAA1130175.1 poly(U)-specific 3'-to-5' RNA exonuclease [Puccinia graminis f. sp. tritici]
MNKQSDIQGTGENGQSSGGIKRRRKLPAPSFNPSKTTESIADDPSLHQGRKRARPHVDGDWPTHIYISINFQAKTMELLKKIVKELAQEDHSKVWHLLTEGTPSDSSLHLSLSRPAFLKTNERDNFIEELKKVVKGIKLFEVYFSNFSTLVNDEGTRAFLALEVGSGHSLLCDLLKQIDKTLELFCQNKYYENPRFHVSIAWCLLEQQNQGTSTDEVIPKSFLQSINSSKLDYIRNMSWKIDCFNVVIGKTTHKIVFDELN